jgi:hemophore-related protein
MKRITTVLAAGTIGLVGFGLAVPALADTGSATSTTSTTKLTEAQKQSIEDFLADHPQLAQALAGRAADWAKLIAAHPEIKAELAKVLALPADQRRAELKTWLAANPDAKQALQDYRKGLKEQRLTKQRNRLDQRLKRLNGAKPGSTTPNSTAPNSVKPNTSASTSGFFTT